MEVLEVILVEVVAEADQVILLAADLDLDQPPQVLGWQDAVDLLGHRPQGGLAVLASSGL